MAAPDRETATVLLGGSPAGDQRGVLEVAGPAAPSVLAADHAAAHVAGHLHGQVDDVGNKSTAICAPGSIRRTVEA